MHSSHHGRALRALAASFSLLTGLLVSAAARAEEAPTLPAMPAVGSFVLQPPDGAPQRDVAEEEPATRPADPRPVRIGILAGVGVPSLMNFGVTVKVTRYLGLGATLGMIPTVKVPLYGEATLSYQEYDAYLRVYPFGGGFFLGSGVGYATVKGSFTQTADIPAMYGMSAQQLSLSSDATVRSLVITPKIGYLYTSEAGFLVGLDLGAQVPIAASQTSLTTNLPAAVPASYTNSATSQVNSSLTRIGQQVIPTLSLNLGWLF
jgi:hypothetical protein